MLGARGVVRLQALRQGEEFGVVDAAGGLVSSEPAHAPSPVSVPRLQLAGPRRVPLHRPPHQIADIKLATLFDSRYFIGAALRIYRAIIVFSFS